MFRSHSLSCAGCCPAFDSWPPGGKRQKRLRWGLRWGLVTNKTFADTWIPQDTSLILNSAFIFFLTLILTRPYRFISILLDSPCVEYRAEHQRQSAALSITFRKKVRPSSFSGDRRRNVKSPLQMPLECQRGKRPWMSQVWQGCGSSFLQLHRGVDGFRYRLPALHLLSACPLNLCSF